MSDPEVSYHHSRSPFAQSLLDFSRNRLAMCGLAVVSLIAALVVVAPWVCQHDPTELRPWIGAQLPGTRTPECNIENTFMVGQAAESTPEISRVREIEMSVENRDATEVRIALRRGKINRLTLVAGAIPVEELDLKANAENVMELTADGGIGRQLPKVKLRVGEQPPPGFMPPGERVMFFQMINRISDTKYVINLEEGIVASIRQNGNQIDSATIKGDTVREVVADGKLLTRTYVLGTDELGRDLFSRILYGGRISLLIGVAATLVSLVIGVCYGSISAYFGGRVDRTMMSVVDILYALPFMFLVIILLVLFGRNIIILFVALGAVQWLTMARIIRGQILSLKEMEFVAAARVCGAGPIRILFRHLIPNAIGPMIIYTTLTVPLVILEESFLSFIGLTVQFRGENLDSWGALVHQGMLALGADGAKSWLLIWPSLVMALTLFGLNCIGDGLRDSFDPKTRKIG